MSLKFDNKMRINHYISCIQDIKANIKITKEIGRRRILRFLVKEYKRRIEFYKELNKMEVENERTKRPR